MRSSRLMRWGWLAAVSLTAACTSLIGVDDVALAPPDADRLPWPAASTRTSVW